MPRTLLLADDSLTIQKVVSITFAAEDFQVVAVDNGEDALAKVRELRPALVLADVVMPRRNGYELSHAIKSDPELCDIPVLLLAGTFEPFDPAKAAEARADGHIVKPFDSQVLIDKVNDLLAGVPAQAAAQAPAPPAAVARAAAPREVQPGAPRPASLPGLPPSAPTGVPQRPQPLSAMPQRAPTAPFGALPLATPPAPSSPSFAQVPATPVTRPAFVPQAPTPVVPRTPLPLGAPPAAVAPLPLALKSAQPSSPGPAPLPLRPTQPSSPGPAPLPLRPTQPSSPGPAPLPLRPAQPSSPGPAPLPLTLRSSQPSSPGPAPLPLTLRSSQPSSPGPDPLPLWPAPLPGPVPLSLGQPLPARQPTPQAQPTPLPLVQPLSGWGTATMRPPGPSASTPTPLPPAARPFAPTAPSGATPLQLTPSPAALTSAWGTPIELPRAQRRDPSAPSAPVPHAAPEAASMVEAAAEAAVAASVQPSMTELSLDVPLDEPLEGDPTEGFDLGAEEPTVPASAHDGFELGGSLDLDISMTGGASPFTSGSLADFSQQESPSASGGLELDAGDEDVPLELAAAHEFLGGPPAESVRAPLPLTLRAAPLAPAIAARPLTPLPLTPAIAPRPTTPSPLAAPLPSARVEALKSTAPDLGPRAPSAGDAQGEAALRLALSQASREVIERIVWEVVPQLAEVMLREHIERLAQDRAGK